MSQLQVNRINDASGGVLAPISSVMRNRIINGGMTISQRNGTSSVTITDTSLLTYTLDRWFGYGSSASKFSIQQDAGAVTPPVGFSDYLGVTSLAATTVAAGDLYFAGQYIEGFNTADLGWGTANAKTVTLSFQVRSSLTGTFGGALTNFGNTRSYPFTYSIPTANTWTTISITIAGDITGTWVGATNSVGLRVFFGLGMGSTFSGTAGAWAGADYRSATGATNVVSTNGATWYLTGVQLEVGTQATSFEYRQYQQELALAQRYYTKLGASPQGSSGYQAYGAGSCNTSTNQNTALTFPQVMRASPTVAFTANIGISVAGGYTNCTLAAAYAGTSSTLLQTSSSATGGGGDGCVLLSNSDSAAFISLSAEL